MLTRRTALLSTLAAGACTSLPRAGDSGEPLDAQFRNIATPSESVHSGIASEDGEQRLTVRLCRYPELGLAWVWVHARVGGEFYSYVDHIAPCGGNATPTEGSEVTYADAAQALSFTRRGAVNKPLSATINGRVMARKSTTSAFGAGDSLVDVAISFHPERLYEGLNKGRTEVFGHSAARVTVNGKRHDIEGPAQFHEQRQATPRFTAPFCYMTFWGEDAATTMLVSPNRRDGYLLEGDKSTEVENVTLDPPGERRAIHVKLADGRAIEGEARVMQAYTIPMVGNTWRGHMVKVTLGGRSFMGHVNDYIIGPGVPYGG